MPTYDYLCKACGERLEIFQPITEAPKRKCPRCGKQRLERQIGAGAGFLFKGGGFYQTDYRSEGYKAAAKAEQGGGGDAEAKTAASAGGDGATDKGTASKSTADAAPAPAKKDAGKAAP